MTAGAIIGIDCAALEAVMNGHAPLRAPSLRPLLDAVRRAIGGAEPVAVGAATNRASDVETICAELGTRVWTCRPWEADLAGALDRRAGIVVHSGQRSGVTVVDADGRVHHKEGDDDVLGEEGSALWLGTRALRLAVQASLGRIQRSERLERALLASFGADSLDELMAAFQNGRVARDEITGFVPVLLHLAAYPDPDVACRALLLAASRHLSHMTAQALSDAALRGDALRNLRGSWSGVAMHGSLLDIFRGDIERYAAGIAWDTPLGTAAQGAAQLAQAAHGTGAATIDADVWRSWMRTA